MNTYFATFISGFSELISELLHKFDGEIQIVNLHDGLVVFKTNKSVEAIKNLKYFSNIFSLIGSDNNPKQTLENFIEELSRSTDIKNINLPKKNKFFRIVISEFNKIISLDQKILSDLEKYISDRTELEVDRSLPDSEFWIIARSEELFLFGHRVTYHSDYKKVLNAGQLRPDLCNLLCMLSEPQRDDIFLDPFAGSDAIANERKRIMGYKQVLSGDILFKGDKHLDALNLKDRVDNSVNKIVTDPPWGMSSRKNLDFEDFYSEMLNEFYRVMRVGGIAVILIGQKDLFDKLLAKFSNKLELNRSYDILVNGKKAKVYKLIKK